MGSIFLVRHASSVLPGPGFEDELTRPLSETGFQEAERLVHEIVALAPARILSSPYLRAVQTVQPAADVLGLPVEIEPEFFEHRMSDRPISHWREVLQKQWSDFDFALDGGDSFSATIARIQQVKDRLEQLDEVAVLAGHGTVISLWLHLTGLKFGFEEHLAMPNPAIYCVHPR